MCKKSFLFFLVFFSLVFSSAAQQQKQLPVIQTILKLLADSKEELTTSKQEIASLKQDLANSLRKIDDMQITINLQQQQLNQASVTQTKRLEASKNESKDFSELTISLQNSYNKLQTKNIKLEAKNKSQNKTITNLIIIVIILFLTTVGPWVIRWLRRVKVIPI